MKRMIKASLLFVGLILSAVSASASEPVLVGPPLHTPNGCRNDVDWTLSYVAKATGFPESDVELGMTWRSLTIQDFCSLAKNRLIRAISRVNKPKPDSPGEWARYRAETQMDENGVVKSGGLMEALAQRENLTLNPSLGVAGLRTDSWTALGPGNIGGRIRAISINPTDANDILIGSISGGFFRSTNGGTNFSAVNDFLVNLAVSTIARDPNTPTRLYAGTGEGFFNSDAIRGHGVFFSTNDGLVWSQVPNTVPDLTQPPSSRTSDFAYVNRVAVHPTNSNIMLLATTGYYCNWGGVYRTTNALSATPTWTLVYGRRALDVKFDPNNPDRVVVGEGSHCDPVSGGSDNGGGVGFVNDITTAITATSGNAYLGSFTRTKLNASSTGRIELAFGQATNGLVVALQDYNGGTFYVSTNSGQTWAQNSANSNILSTQGWYNNVVWVDPTDSTRVLVGGIDLWKSTAVASWWTTNSAISWSRLSQWQFGGSYGNSAHADHHAIVAHPGYNGTSNRAVFFGNDGGVYKANDVTTINGDSAGTGWTKLNNGLEVTQFYSGAGTVVGGTTRIQGGTQDNGQLFAPSSGTNWSTWQGGDGGYAAVDPADANVFYGAYIRGSISRTKNGGASLSYICKGTADNVNNITEGLAGASYCGTAATGEANFITPFILDPNNSDRMLVGAKSLWVSADAKSAVSPSWAIRKAAIGSGSSFYISALAVAPGNSNIVWVGHNNGAVYCTTNGMNASPTWDLVASTPARRVLRFMIDASNNNRVFVTYGGYSSPNIFETTSGCVASPTWTARHAALPAAPVRSILRHPSNANWLYVGTEVGVFASTDGGVNWAATMEGPGSVSVDELFWLDATTLVAATHGRGMFKTTIAPGVLQFASSSVSVPEGGGSVMVNVTRTGGSAGSVSVSYATVAEAGVGKATAGIDYAATSGTLTWADSESGTKSFLVSVTNDALVEGAETIRVDLTSPSEGASLGGAATFTITIVDDDTAAPLRRSDFNDDGRSDLLWRNMADGSVQGWLMNGLSATQVVGLLPVGGYTISHVADLDGNGKADTLIRHTDGTIIGWLHDGLNVVGQATFFAAGSGWSIKQTPDLNGDGKADLIVEHTDGRVVAWLMDGLTVTGTATFVPAGTGWSVSRVGDLNGDGKTDLIWQNTNGTVQAWLMDGLNATQTATFVGTGAGWSVKLVGDFNADNKADLVWQNTDGTVQAWLMNGLTVSQIASFVPAGTGWSPVLAGDISGDNKADLFWQHTDGRSQTWLMDGLTVMGLGGFVGAGNWSATHLLDLNGDGRKDVLWQNTDGTVQAWLMNGLNITQIASMTGPGTYSVIPPRE